MPTSSPVSIVHYIGIIMHIHGGARNWNEMVGDILYIPQVSPGEQIYTTIKLLLSNK